MTESSSSRQPATEAPPRPHKDLWDKISALTVPFVSLVVGLLGAYATYTYNQSDLRQKAQQAAADNALRAAQQEAAKEITQAQLLQQLFEFVASSDPQRREFGYEMYAAMGKGELAAKLIAIKNDQAGIAVLKKLAGDADPAVSAAAAKGLAGMLRSQSSCEDFAKQGFRVARVPATAADYAAIATELGIEPQALAAFMRVEGSGDSILPDGRPKILFERHMFSRLTQGKFDATDPDVSNPAPGGYGPVGAAQYDRLTKAASLSCPAALAATSWGTFQIMGEFYKQAGYGYVDDFVKDIMSSGPKELRGGMTFLKSAGVLDALKAKDWALVARRMNGPTLADRYAQRLQAAYVAAENVHAQ